MTKAYLMGFIFSTMGKSYHNMENPWYNPFSERGYIDCDEEEYKEFVRGWDEANNTSGGMDDILKLAEGK